MSEFPTNPGPDFEEDLDAALSFRPAPPRHRHRHSREQVRARAKTPRYKQRDHRRERDIDPWWSRRDRHHGLLLQKGKRP